MTAGVIYDPVHQEMFWAKRGKGAYVNSKRSASQKSVLVRGVMATVFPFRARDLFDEYMESFRRSRSGQSGCAAGG